MRTGFGADDRLEVVVWLSATDKLLLIVIWNILQGMEAQLTGHIGETATIMTSKNLCLAIPEGGGDIACAPTQCLVSGGSPLV